MLPTQIIGRSAISVFAKIWRICNAKIHIKLNNEIKIPDDSQARITSSSLLGGNFLDIIPGSSETYLKPDDIIYDTTDAVSFTDLLGKVVFSKE